MDIDAALGGLAHAKVTIKNEIPAKTYARIWATTQKSAIISII